MVKKWLYMLLGLICLTIAVLGFILPGLPGTPFLLLSASCFAKSSTRMYNWLLANRTFGPMISDWQEHRSISRRIRNVAVISMLLMGSISVLILAEYQLIQLMVATTVLLGSYFVMQIRVTEQQSPSATE